jgi:Stage II sporulation protein E (SpoIIE)
MNASEELFGEDRLADFLSGCSNGTADSFANDLLNELALWCGRAVEEERQDDLTLLALRFRNGTEAGLSP